eukprot:TRINITY_DN104_c0_g1_i1.p1 TRINITY_DN104_c0_g1~~TRINITY_DN104_c0_g1_i1.p1  ORF type:complete len:155 (+),score=16.77 TRINITY_DN104_c0_g1_i1:682-1146(+)
MIKSLSRKIICQGDVHVSHAQYSYLSGHNIFIDRQASHCTIKAVSLLQVGQSENPQGKIFGGEIIDAGMVIAGEIGNESGAKMLLNMASSATDVTIQIDECLKETAKAEEQLDTLQATLDRADLVKDAEKKSTACQNRGDTAALLPTCGRARKT